jgi:hypothetical protein
MLHHEPESLESARQRVREALATCYEIGDLPVGECRLSAQRKHVLDFHDGMRLIVSREVYPNDPRSVVATTRDTIFVSRDADAPDCPMTVVHVSASLDPAYWLVKRYRDRSDKGWTSERIFNDFAQLVQGRCRALLSLPADSKAFGDPTYVTESFIPHWLVPEDEFAHLFQE